MTDHLPLAHAVEWTREKHARPKIIPLGGGEAVPYTRASSFAKTLEDTYLLNLWDKRMTALGLADHSHYLEAVRAHRDNKNELNQILEHAKQAAQADAAATRGTARHKLAEKHDRGEPLGPLSTEEQADVDAYIAATRDLTIISNEQRLVHDDLKISGTPDRIVEYKGKRYIADLKTGNIDLAQGSIAVQLALYAHMDIYLGDKREPTGVETDKAIVIHLPANTGQCQLQDVDIRAGWNAVHLATLVKAWRARKDLITPLGPMVHTMPVKLTDTPDIALFPNPADTIAAAAEHDCRVLGCIQKHPPSWHSDTPALDPILSLIAAADSVEDLNNIWAWNKNAWHDEHTRAGSARKAQLQGSK